MYKEHLRIIVEEIYDLGQGEKSTMLHKNTKLKKLASIMLVIMTACMLIGNTLSSSIHAATYTPRTTAPAKDNKYYYSKINPFYPNYGLPNCTCYAYGRAYEILGVDPKLPTGNAGTWYEKDTTHEKGSTPQLGAIACWKGTSSNYNGHVAVVEAIDGNKISFSESNYGGEIFRYQKNIVPSSYASKAPYNYTFQGYIYIGEAPEPISPGTMSGTYIMKNIGTNSYAYVNGKDADKTDIALGTAKSNDTYKMNFIDAGSGTQPSCFIQPAISKERVVNPFADTPKDGTNVNLYKKSNDGTQQWVLESVKDGYVIRNYTNHSLVLTASDSSVKVKTYSSGNKNQIWSLESPSISVNAVFHRNLNAEDTNNVTETFTVGVSNQKFGYKPDGTGRYSSMNEASVGFGKWINPGYKLLGWSTDQNATTARWKTYSAVEDAWIKMYSPKVDLYAVWEADSPKEGDVNTDGQFDIADVVLFQKWLLAVTDTKLENLEAADINKDDKINILDLCVIKNKLIYG